MFFKPFCHVFVGSADTAFGIGLYFWPFVRFATGSRKRQVVLFRTEKTIFNPSIDGASRILGKELRIVCDNGIHRLSIAHRRRENLIHFGDSLSVRMNTCSAVYECPSIVYLCARGNVIAFSHWAVMFFFAPIAHVRSAVEAFAYGFSEVWA